MIPLSPETQKRIEGLFPENEWEAVEALLRDECGDTLPLVEPSYVELAERIRFATLKLSDGAFPKLKEWVDDAKVDWRDTLTSAGFASSTRVHLDWMPG